MTKAQRKLLEHAARPGGYISTPSQKKDRDKLREAGLITSKTEHVELLGALRSRVVATDAGRQALRA